MKDVSLGDVLDNGSVVYSTMQIDNRFCEKKEILYEIPGSGINKETIFVTGSHLVFDSKEQKFVKVQDYSRANKTQEMVDWFSCLITSDHKIQIGSETFWDWEDHFIKK